MWIDRIIKEGLRISIVGPPNAGKTSLANRICKDWTGEEIGKVSRVPHETRHVQFKEEVDIKYKEKSLKFKLIDTPGIVGTGQNFGKSSLIVLVKLFMISLIV